MFVVVVFLGCSFYGLIIIEILCMYLKKCIRFVCFVSYCRVWNCVFNVKVILGVVMEGGVCRLFIVFFCKDCGLECIVMVVVVM